jgi:hypothetical protein
MRKNSSLDFKEASMNRFWFMMVSLLLFVVGLFVVVNSVAWGREAANSYLRSQGGGMDTAQFMIVVQSSIDTYRWLGSILSLIGGVGLLRTIELK